MPLFHVASAHAVFERIELAFAKHESHHEPSVEFKHPGPSSWRHAQAWAQTAVDRPEGAPLPPYEPEYDPEPPTDHLSFALGVALGRFGGGEGILDPATADLSHALPAGILFLDGTLDANDRHDGLGHPAAEPLHAAWAGHGAAVDSKSDLRTWLRLKFFKDVHRSMYENRPIHWPLSSDKRTFVAGKKDYDWSHLAMRYWPDRVDAKCREDPSLGVAHGCFWAYHPARAWAWELRLQDEIAPGFRSDEGRYRDDPADSAAQRAAYLAEHPEEALVAVAKEALRRRRKHKALQPELHLLEPGLWTDHPAQCWDLELAIIDKQGADFHLRAPDEPAVRAAFKQANPTLVADRADLLLRLVPRDDLLTTVEPDEEAGGDDEMDYWYRGQGRCGPGPGSGRSGRGISA